MRTVHGIVVWAILLLAGPWMLLGHTQRAAADVAELNIVLAVDLNASKVGGEDAIMRPAMKANLKHMRDVIDEVYNSDLDKFRGRMFCDVIDDVSPQGIRKFFASRSYDPKRAYLFYYAGHGATDPNKGHYFATSGGNILRSEVFNLMNDLGPSAIFLISDCCSSFANFQPPVRRTPAKWKVFYDLFYKSESVYNITGASRGQFGWVSDRDGGFFTSALTKYLCEPRDQIRFDGKDDTVGWDDFFRRVRDTTEDIFQNAKTAAPANAQIRDSNAQTPEAFRLGGWEKQYRRSLVLINNTGEKLCVWLQYYDLNFATAEWQWYYPTPNAVRYELAPGAVTTLRHEHWTIGAHRARIWAASLDGRCVWENHKNKDLVLEADGYAGPYGEFKYTFRP